MERSAIRVGRYKERSRMSLALMRATLARRLTNPPAALLSQSLEGIEQALRFLLIAHIVRHGGERAHFLAGFVYPKSRARQDGSEWLEIRLGDHRSIALQPSQT